MDGQLYLFFTQYGQTSVSTPLCDAGQTYYATYNSVANYSTVD